MNKPVKNLETYIFIKFLLKRPPAANWMFSGRGARLWRQGGTGLVIELSGVSSTMLALFSKTFPPIVITKESVMLCCVGE